MVIGMIASFAILIVLVYLFTLLLGEGIRAFIIQYKRSRTERNYHRSRPRIFV